MDNIEDQILTNCKIKSVMPNAFDYISSDRLNAILGKSSVENTWLVTSNQRLSRFRLQEYEREQIKSGKQAWATPNIIPWSAWLRQQWGSSELGVWLTTQQEMLLWRQTILEDDLTQVLNTKALSKQAMDAWKILFDFQINPTCLDGSAEEHIALWRWGHAVSEKTEHKLQHEILPLLTSHMATKHAPCTIILDGFDILSPAQTSYLKHMQSTGNTVLEVSNHHKSALCYTTAYPDENTELRQICHQIRLHLEKQPEAKIGVFIPDLERRAHTINRVFAEELAPALSLQSDTDLQGEYFNISLGSALAKQPMIQSAFVILSLSMKRNIQYQELSQLLLCPYILGYEEELQQRAALDAACRERNQSEYTLEQFLHICNQTKVQAPLFQQWLAIVLDYTQQKSFAGKQMISSWMLLVEQIFTALTWDNQAITPNERSQVQGWRDLIEQVTSLDDFCGMISWSQALSHLQEQAHEHLFRPAPGHANIQVMGLLEAANLHFDYAFAIGLDDITWPPAAKPNPLIPFDIQVLHQTPHANSEREWLYAQTVWENLQYVSPTLEVSYAKSKDHQNVQASPLLQTLGSIEDAEAKNSMRFATMLQQHTIDMEPITENNHTVSPDEKIRGGTGILKSQSNCAFQAFARYRLHLRDIKQPSLGLNAAEQGVLLHAALEAFWKKIETLTNLLQLIEKEQLEAEVSTAIQHAWPSLERIVSFEIKSLEEQRLQKLLQTWLRFESKREPFKVIATEVWRNFNVGHKNALTLHTKLDRIDQNTSGQQIVLDYKTGETTAAKALGLRPEEPQIPAYFLAEKALNVDVVALAIAQVKSGSLGFKGFAQETGVLPNIHTFKGRVNQPENWDELIAQWQEVLNRLADEFIAGEANVAPKNNQSCNYCDFAGLCRISSVP